MEDALSLDDDSSDGQENGLPQANNEIRDHLFLQRGFLLPRSPARFFLHDSFIQTALNINATNQLASATNPIITEDGDTCSQRTDQQGTQDDKCFILAETQLADVMQPSGCRDSGVCELVREYGDETILDACTDDEYGSPACSSGGYLTPTLPLLLTESTDEGEAIFFYQSLYF